MKITLESTSKVVQLRNEDGVWVPARIWEGETASGIKLHAYITRIAADQAQDLQQFDRELQEHAAPSAEIELIPLRMIL